MNESVLLFNSYKLFPDGSIFSVRRNRYLKASLSKNGYYVIGLRNGDENKTYYVHRLVAKFFIDNPDDCCIVDHIDRDKTNNNKENLRWATRELNAYNKGCPKHSKTGIKYICYSDKVGYYIFQIKRNGKRIRRCCKNLEKLVNYRNYYLDSINDPYPRE
jgi:hypothetical protein